MMKYRKIFIKSFSACLLTFGLSVILSSCCKEDSTDSNQTKTPYWDEALYRQIESSIIAPTFPDRIYDITSYGASTSADAATNQQAINAAIDACSQQGGGFVVVSGGKYSTGAISLKSNVNLHINAGDTLLFAFDPTLYPLVQTRWEGLDLMNYSPCIYATDAKNVAISGNGTIDGNGSNDTWWQWNGNTKFGYVDGVTTESQNMPFVTSSSTLKKYETDDQGNAQTNRGALDVMSNDGLETADRIFGVGHGLRPQSVCMINCENILIEGVTMLNSPFWTIHPLLSKNVTVRNVTVQNSTPNGDGCDPESCENVLIENCTFSTGDDCIAIKSGRNADGRRTVAPTKNVIVRGCTMSDGHGGVVIGSETSSGVANVFVENCTMDSPNLERVLRIKTNTCRGGVTEGIHMRNVTVGQCNEAVLKINLVYQPTETAPRGFIPTVKNVSMENVNCQKSQYGILINALDDQDCVYDITVNNCNFSGITVDSVEVTGKAHNLDFKNNIYTLGK